LNRAPYFLLHGSAAVRASAHGDHNGSALSLAPLDSAAAWTGPPFDHGILRADHSSRWKVLRRGHGAAIDHDPRLSPTPTTSTTAGNGHSVRDRKRRTRS